jgi:hypothetical protein
LRDLGETGVEKKNKRPTRKTPAKKMTRLKTRKKIQERPDGPESGRLSGGDW